MFSVEGEKEECTSAYDSLRVGWIGRDFGDEFFDVRVQCVGLVQTCEERFESIEVDIDSLGCVSYENGPKRRLYPRLL